jgi:hypothetical protein
MKKLFVISFVSLSCSFLCASDNSQKEQRALGKEEQNRLLVSIKDEIGALNLKINAFEQTNGLICAVSPAFNITITCGKELSTFFQEREAVRVAPDFKVQLSRLKAINKTMDCLVVRAKEVLQDEMQELAARKISRLKILDSEKQAGKTV